MITYNFTQEQKDTIRAQAQAFVDTFGGSISKAANSINGFGESTLRSVLKGKYASISDEMWRTIRSQVAMVGKEATAAIVETSVTRDLGRVIADARAEKECVWAMSPAGSGKTISTRLAKQQPHTYYMLCDEAMSKNDFAHTFVRSLGLRVNSTYNSRTVILAGINYLREQPNALMIFDEGDKLKDPVLHFFITMYNYLEDAAGELTVGLLFVSTEYVKKRMEDALRRNKKGFSELYSRVGARIYEVDKNTPNDIVAICRARGLNEQRDIAAVLKEADRCNYDLRRVTRIIKMILRKNGQSTIAQ